MPFALEDLDSNFEKAVILALFWKLYFTMVSYLCEHIWRGLHLGRIPGRWRQLSRNGSHDMQKCLVVT